MNVVLIVLNALGLLYGLWFAAVAIAGSLKKAPPTPQHAPQHRFAVLVPARNEEAVIGHLVRSLMNQQYPRALYDVLVIPNGCTDNTAAAARLEGARILECTAAVHSKGDVLRFAFAHIPDMGKYDAYCILDADNLAAPGFLRAANDILCAGWEIAQGYRDSKNPSDSWVAGDTSIFFWIMNRFYNRARHNLGMSAALNGTGIVISAALIARMGWNVRSLTEDLEFSGECAASGVKIGYMPGAVIYDEQPARLRDSMVQRRRWFAGNIQCLKIHFKKLARRPSLHAFDMLMVFMGAPMQIISLMPGIAGALSIALNVARGKLALSWALGLGAFAVAAAYILMALFALMVCLLEGKLQPRRIMAILMFPVYMVTWFFANMWAIVTPAPRWTQITHIKGTDNPE